MMNKIFIEAKKEATAECQFLKTILSLYFPDKEVKFVCMDGVGNLFTESIMNQIEQAAEDGEQVIVLLDADTVEKQVGFVARCEDIIEKQRRYGMNFPFFLYPNHADDGDVETLMESLARKDLHHVWWDCFEDYERCVGGVSDETGLQRYVLPNRKAKLHTFISSQRLKKPQRDKLGGGNWLFDDADYWDLSRQELHPLVEFFRNNLQ